MEPITTDWPLLVAIAAVLGAVSVNAFNFSRESKYYKQKNIRKGYKRGYKQAIKDMKEMSEK